MSGFKVSANVHGTAVVEDAYTRISVTGLAEGVDAEEYLRQSEEALIERSRLGRWSRVFLGLAIAGSAPLAVCGFWVTLSLLLSLGDLSRWFNETPLWLFWAFYGGVAVAVAGAVPSFRFDNRYDSALKAWESREAGLVVARVDSLGSAEVADSLGSLLTFEVRGRLAELSRAEGVNVASSILKAWVEDLETDRRLERSAAVVREADRLGRLRAEVVGE